MATEQAITALALGHKFRITDHNYEHTCSGYACDDCPFNIPAYSCILYSEDNITFSQYYKLRADHPEYFI